MSRYQTPDIYACNECGRVMDEHARRMHLDHEGAISMADDPNGYDFCSLTCVAAWATKRQQRRL